jgi:hypothetical protein
LEDEAGVGGIPLDGGDDQLGIVAAEIEGGEGVGARAD